MKSIIARILICIAPTAFAAQLPAEGSAPRSGPVGPPALPGPAPADSFYNEMTVEQHRPRQLLHGLRVPPRLLRHPGTVPRAEGRPLFRVGPDQGRRRQGRPARAARRSPPPGRRASRSSASAAKAPAARAFSSTTGSPAKPAASSSAPKSPVRKVRLRRLLLAARKEGVEAPGHLPHPHRRRPPRGALLLRRRFPPRHQERQRIRRATFGNAWVRLTAMESADHRRSPRRPRPGKRKTPSTPAWPTAASTSRPAATRRHHPPQLVIDCLLTAIPPDVPITEPTSPRPPNEGFLKANPNICGPARSPPLGNGFPCPIRTTRTSGYPPRYPRFDSPSQLAARPRECDLTVATHHSERPLMFWVIRWTDSAQRPGQVDRRRGGKPGRGRVHGPQARHPDRLPRRGQRRRHPRREGREDAVEVHARRPPHLLRPPRKARPACRPAACRPGDRRPAPGPDAAAPLHL